MTASTLCLIVRDILPRFHSSKWTLLPFFKVWCFEIAETSLEMGGPLKLLIVRRRSSIVRFRDAALPQEPVEQFQLKEAQTLSFLDAVLTQILRCWEEVRDAHILLWVVCSCVFQLFQ